MAENDTELFNKDGVITAMNAMGDIFSSIAETYATTDAEMATQLTTADGAMYGAGATKLLSAWDENSGTLEDFMSTFDNWSALVSGMAAKFTNLEEGTYEVKGLDDEYKKAVNAARAFHTTSLKTAAGAAAFNTAQESYFAEHPDMISLDENGIGYASIKTLDHGKIVEARVYTAEDGTQYAEVERWGWSEEEGKFVTTTDYYKDVTIDEDTGKLNFDENKKLTKEEFYSEDYYYSDKNKELIIKNTSDKLTAEYLENGELSEDTLKELEKLPDDMKDKVLEELQNRKDSLGELDGVRKYDENGKLESITYTGDDGLEYTIQYEYDEDGNVIGVKYLVNGKPISNKDESVHDFYSHILGDENQSGEGTTGSEPTYTVEEGTVTYSLTDEEGTKEYSLSTENDQTILKIGENEYIVEYDGNGFIFKYADIGKEVDEGTAQELTEAMKALMGNNYAKGLVNYQDGDVQYNIDEEGNVSSHQVLDGQKGNLPEGELNITYNPDGTVKEITFTDKNGNENNYTEEQLEGLLNPEPIDNGDGTVSSYVYDPSNGNITITTTDKDDTEKVMSIEIINKTDNTTTTQTFTYTDGVTSIETKKVDEQNNIIGKSVTTEVYDENGELIGKKTEHEVGEGENSYQYLDSKTGELVDVSSDQYEKLSGNNQEEGVTYELEDGVYREITAGEDEDHPKLVHEEYPDGHTSDKELQDDNSYITTEDYGDENEYQIIEDDNGTKYTVNGEEVTPEQYQNITGGPTFDEKTKETTTYSLDNDGVYTETTTVEGLDEPTRIFKEFDENHTYLEEYDKDTNITTTTETIGEDEYITQEAEGSDPKYTVNDTAVSETQFTNLKDVRSVENTDGTTTNYTIEDGKYTESIIYNTGNTEGKPKQITIQNANDEPTYITEYEYKTNGDLKSTVYTNNKTHVATTQTYIDGDENKLLEKVEEKLVDEDNLYYYTRTTTYRNDGSNIPTEVVYTGSFCAVSDDSASDQQYYKGTQTIKYFDNGKPMTETIEGDNINISVTYSQTTGNRTEYHYKTSAITRDYTYFDSGKLHTSVSENLNTGRTTSSTYTELSNKSTYLSKYSETDNNGSTEKNFEHNGTTSYLSSEIITNKSDQTRITNTYEYSETAAGHSVRTDIRVFHTNNSDHEWYHCKSNGEPDILYNRRVTVGDEVFSYNTETGTYNVPVRYTNDGYTLNKTVIDAIADSNSIPILVDSTTSSSSNFARTLDAAEEHVGEVFVMRKGTQVQYDMSPNNVEYELNYTVDEDTAYIIEKDDNGSIRLVNAANPEEWFYAKVLNTSSSRDHNEKTSITYEELRRMRANYSEGMTETVEFDLDSANASDVVRSSTNSTSIPPGQGFGSEPIGQASEIKGYKTSDNSELTINDLKETVNYASDYSRNTLYWKAKIPNVSGNVKFEYTNVNGHSCYIYKSGSTMYMLDPKTGNVYKTN